MGRESNFFPYQLLCSIQVFSELNEAHPQWGGQCALLSRPFHMLITSRSTLTDRPRIMSNQISLHHVTQSTWHIKLAIRTHDMRFHPCTSAQINIHMKCSLFFLLISGSYFLQGETYDSRVHESFLNHIQPRSLFFLLNSCSIDV